MPGKYCTRSVLVSSALLLLLLLPKSQAFADTSVGGTIATDTFWTAANSPYIVTSSVTVQGTDGADGITTLTIEPGVELRFNPYTQLTIGASSGNPGALVAQGTAGSPILFTSNKVTPAAGDWYGIRFQNTSDDATSILQYCTIDYAGYSSGALYLYYASPRILNCVIASSKSQGIYGSNSSPQIVNNTISNSASHGLYLSSGAPTITGNTFINSGNYDIYISTPTGGSITGNNLGTGLYLSGTGVGNLTGNTINYNATYPLHLGANDVGAVLTGNTFNNMGAGAYLEVIAGTVTKDATWPALMPYHILGNITVQGTDGADGITTLTIDPGVELRFNPYTQLTIGASSGNPGALVARGTLPSPVVFTANQAVPAPGNWTGISFQNTASDATSIVELCRIEYASNCIYCNNAKPTIQGNTLRQASNAGLYFTGAGGNDTVVECNTISDNKYGIYISYALPLAHHNDLLSNSLYGMYNAGATQVNAENNWWGSAADAGSGTKTVYGSIDYAPWSTAINDCKSNYGTSDATAPELVTTSPADGAVLQAIANITFTLHDQESAINDLAVINSVVVLKVNGTAVSGATAENNDTFDFTPNLLPLADGLYTVTLTASDVIGNAASYSFSFTIDTQGPQKPVITGGLVASGTIRERPAQNIAGTVTILLTGTAENQTILWINDTQHQEITSGSWSVTLTLMDGDNTFEVWVEDGIGNCSPAAWVDIWLETAPMLNLEYDEAGRLQKTLPLQY